MLNFLTAKCSCFVDSLLIDSNIEIATKRFRKQKKKIQKYRNIKKEKEKLHVEGGLDGRIGQKLFAKFHDYI